MKIRDIFAYLISAVIVSPIAFLLITTFILSRHEEDQTTIRGIGHTMVNASGNPDLAVEKGIGSSDELYTLVTVGSKTFAQPYQGQGTADTSAQECKYTLSWYSGTFAPHSGGLVNARDLISKENCKPVDAPN
jgi:hypothetical protein